MTRHKFGNESSSQTTRWLPAGQIDVDPTVQRPLNIAWAEKIGRELDPDLVGVIHVSQRSAERYVCVDGQHRLHGIKNVFGDNGTLVECKVYTDLSRAEEAKLFCGLNNVKRPRHLEMFLKSVIAKDTHALAITAVVHEMGCRVDYAQANRSISAIAALEDVYFGFADRRTRMTPSDDAEDKKTEIVVMPGMLKTTLGVIDKAWGGIADSMHGAIISGIGRLVIARHRVMELDDLAKRLALYPGGPTALIGAARGRRVIEGGSVGTALAMVCVDLYNKKRHTGKIEKLQK